MDTSYWTLFVEIKFYLLVSLVYFTSAKYFPRNFLITSIILTLGYFIFILFFSKNGLAFWLFFNPFSPDYLPWFFYGVGSYLIWSRQAVHIGWAILGVAIVNLVTTCVWQDLNQNIISAFIVFSIFSLALTQKNVKSFLSQKFFVTIGIASYSLYLLHQLIGLTAIRCLAEQFNINSEFSVYLPLLVVLALTGLSCIIYRYWENPLNKYIVSKVLGHNQS